MTPFSYYDLHISYEEQKCIGIMTLATAKLKASQTTWSFPPLFCWKKGNTSGFSRKASYGGGGGRKSVDCWFSIKSQKDPPASPFPSFSSGEGEKKDFFPRLEIGSGKSPWGGREKKAAKERVQNFCNFSQTLQKKDFFFIFYSPSFCCILSIG